MLKRFLNLSFLLLWKSGNILFLPLLASLSVIYNFLLETWSQVLNTVCHSFQLIWWKPEVNISSKIKDSEFQKPSWRSEGATEMTTPQARHFTKSLHCLFGLVYFAHVQWVPAIRDLALCLTGKWAKCAESHVGCVGSFSVSPNY